MINKIKKIIVFENDDLSFINPSSSPFFEFYFINPSSFYKNKSYIKKIFFFYGLDFNEYIKKNFKGFKKNYLQSYYELKKYNFDKYQYETFKNLLIPIISVYYFSMYKLDSGNFYFIKNKSIKKINKTNSYAYLEKFLLANNQLIFLRDKKKQQYFSSTIYLFNKFISFFLRNKKIIHVQDYSYGFKNLISNNKKNTFIKFNYINKFNLLNSILSFITYIFFGDNKLNISIPLIKKPNIYKKDIKLFNHIDNNLSKITNSAFQFINEYSNIIKINFNSFSKNNFNPRFSLFHNLKWSDDLIFSGISSQVYLASHSSHPVPLNKISYFFLKELGNGFLNSNFANTILIQSEHSFQCFKKFNYNLSNYERVERFVWGYSKPKKRNHSKNITLLHAATHKVNSFRPYVYESSNLYYFKLKKLCEFVSKYKNIKLILRPCLNKDFELTHFKEMINEFRSKNITLSYEKPFIDDLNISDILISFSSTAIEEALSLNKKAILLSSKTEHQHFKMNKNIEHINILKISDIKFKNTVTNLYNVKQNKLHKEKNLIKIDTLLNEK